MRVSFEHKEKTFLTKHKITVHVELSPEERVAFKKNSEVGRVILHKLETEYVYVGRLLNLGKYSASCRNLEEAEQLQADWTEKLKDAKRALDNTVDANPTNTSFEL